MLIKFLKLPLLWLLFMPVSSLLGQEKATLSGYVKDANSGETLIAAVIRVNNETISTSTNNYGFYSLTLPPVLTSWR